MENAALAKIPRFQRRATASETVHGPARLDLV